MTEGYSILTKCLHTRTLNIIWVQTTQGLLGSWKTDLSE